MIPIGSSIQWQNGDEEDVHPIAVMPSRPADTLVDKELKKQPVRRNSRGVIDPATALPIEYRSV